MAATLWLLMAAMLGNGLLVGASLDQVIKQLPARHRIGVIAFSDYSRAGDLGRGIAWYAALGVGAALLTVIAAVVGLAERPATQAAWRPLGTSSQPRAGRVAQTVVQGNGLVTSLTSATLETKRTKPRLDQWLRCPGVLPRSRT
jgi:hypothetical protein